MKYIIELIFALILCTYILGVSSSKILRIPLMKSQSTHISSCKEDCMSVPPNNYPFPFQTDYYAKISIGSPPQDFNVLIDTARDTFWIADSGCYSPFCYLHKKFDKSKSKTYRNNGTSFKINEDILFVDGTYFSDNIRLGDQNISNQIFGAAENVQVNVMNMPWDGIFSLNYGKWIVESFFENLIKQNLIEKRMFSVYLNRDVFSTDGGEVVLGGVSDEIRSWNIKYISMVDNVFGWTIQLDNIFIDGNILFTSSYAVFDTKTTGIGVPNNLITEINEKIGAKKNYNGIYVVTCNRLHNLPVVTFSIGGYNFSLDESDYILVDSKSQDEPQCVSLFRNSFTYDRWIFGNTFIGKYRPSFDLDNRKIGLAISSGYTPVSSFLFITIATFLFLSSSNY